MGEEGGREEEEGGREEEEGKDFFNPPAKKGLYSGMDGVCTNFHPKGERNAKNRMKMVDEKYSSKNMGGGREGRYIYLNIDW